MRGRAIAITYIAGVGLAHHQPTAEPLFWLIVYALGTALALLLAKWTTSLWLRYLLLVVATALGAYTITHYQIGLQVAQRLPIEDENQPFRLRVQIDSLVRIEPDSRYFEALVLEAVPAQVPTRIALRWSAKKWGGPYSAPKIELFPELKPGQQWELTAFLKTPTGSRNPGAFDYENHLFSKGIRAVGSIRGEPELVSEHAEQWSVHLAAERWRHTLRQAMMPYLAGSRWAGVLLALSIGDQASIDAQDWLVFNRTGLTHLVSISGSHVTFLAALSAWFFSRLWRYLRWKGSFFAERVPAGVVGGIVALVIAGAYSLTAGWEVPARRTFIMFSVAVFFLLMRSTLSLTQMVAVAAVLVLVFDPWAWFASGFWLSFGAVLVLVACAQWSGTRLHLGSRGAVLLSNYVQAAWWQLFITIALLPPLVFMFFELSLVSPFSNAYAIPLIGLFITPLALLFALLSLLPWHWPASVVFYVAHELLEFTMWMTVWLSHLPAASLPAARPPIWFLAIAMVGVTIALCFRQLPLSVFGWLCVLPSLLWQPPLLANGQWRLHAVDIGQGSALLVETRHRLLLFDTGNRYGPDADEGQRTLIPYLQYLGKKRIDVLVLSHEDLDHIGGTRSVLSRVPVLDSYSPFDLSRFLNAESAKLSLPVLQRQPESMRSCERGHQWVYDEVEFRFLWPEPTAQLRHNDKNAFSCVLQIKGRHHQLLLTGDIGTPQEQHLIELGLSRRMWLLSGTMALKPHPVYYLLRRCKHSLLLLS